MKAKEDSLFGLAPRSTGSAFGGNDGLVALGAGHAFAGEDHRVTTELAKQTSVIDCLAAKTVFGDRKVGEIHQNSIRAFHGLAAHAEAQLESARGKEYYRYVEEFNRRTLENAAKHLWGIAEIGAGSIAVEVQRPLYPQPAPPPRRGLLGFLFGD